MNFLGHLYFSNNDLELMHANLFGDFVKGKNLDYLSESVKRGVVLHRSIDSYIDTHPDVKILMGKLSPELPKVSGIAIDLYFDHFLSVHWDKFHEKPLSLYLMEFYSYSIDKNAYPNEWFHEVLFRLKKGQWINNYSTIRGISRTCEGVSKRISFPNALTQGGEVLIKHYTEIELVFFKYMDDAQQRFEVHK